MYNNGSIANRTTLGGQASCLPLKGLGEPESSLKYQISNLGRRGQARNAFTLVELLVVISIIALLISLLLPALARAKILALRVQSAANLHTLGQALFEYASIYKGQYPLGPCNTWPMAMGVNGEPQQEPNGVSYVPYPTWGPPLLYYTSWNGSGEVMTNIQPGVLSPTPGNIALLYNPQAGYFSSQNWDAFSNATSVSPSQPYAQGGTGLDHYNSQGQYDSWLSGTCYISYNYWVGVNGILARQNNYWGQYSLLPSNPPLDQYANRPISSPSSLLMSDVILLDSPVSAGASDVGLSMGYPAWSNNITRGPLPDGGNELFNDDSVVWKNLGQMNAHYYHGPYWYW